MMSFTIPSSWEEGLADPGFIILIYRDVLFLNFNALKPVLRTFYHQI
jgi:hypothetical protein